MKNFAWLGVAALVCLACGEGGSPRIIGSNATTGGSGGIPIWGTTGGTTGSTTDNPQSTTAWTEPAGSWSSTPAPSDRASQVAQLSTLSNLTTNGLVTCSSGAMNEALGYAPDQAKWLDVIQASALALNDNELAAYKKNGFVISDRQSYPTFFYGFETIYAADLPVYVSADSVLYALHRSYDKILQNLELSYLYDTLKLLLTGVRATIPSAAISDNSRHDLGLLLGVAAGLLDTQATGIDAEMKTFIDKATAASGMETVTIFGTSRDMDFSQFKPRGHYTDYTTLQQYFRAVMWLGRTELRLVDVQADGTRVLSRREVEDVLALRELFATDTQAQWDAIEHIVGLFVGEPDYMTMPQVQQFHDALGIGASTELANVGDQDLLRVIDAGNYGLQRICSQLMLIDQNVTTLPNSFAFLGQRYTVDSHVFSKVVYPNSSLLMPNPLDVAFAAFGNDQAAPLLRSQLDTFGYAPQLGQARQLVEWHDTGYWDSSMYTLWISSLRQLSAGKYDPTSLPAIARTEAWGRRLLNTQLGSWAELRHDTLLYAKQSYTGGVLCEYPDGYVDPYPGLFGRLRQLGTLSAEMLVSAVPAGNWGGDNAVAYFQTLSDVAGRLENLATEELTGAPRTQADLDFLNDAVVTKSQQQGCTFIIVPSGWYARLFYSGDDALKADPTIADVHTQPTDAAGNPVGRVLHVATGNPRLMVVSVDSCNGPRAYAGVVSSYFEQTTSNFERKTDEQWAAELQTATPVDVPWMQDLVVR